MKLGHVHLKVRDLDHAVHFYTTIFGLRVTERLGRHYAFLSASDNHHDIALQQVPPSAPSPGRQSVGLFHTAFEVPSARAFAEAYERLCARHIPVHLADHGISWAMYFSDPDGNGCEIYWDRRGQADSREEWEGWDEQLDPERILALLEQVA